jgi:Uma2 family endonuclease
VRLDFDNEPQLDALLRIDEAAGGQSRIGDAGYIEGPPELVVEVAASSASIDRHAKLSVYRRNGVREYVIWQVRDRRVEWLGLVEGEYVPLAPDASGTISSGQFPGLRLATESLLAGDLAAVLTTQLAALHTPPHREFVAALAVRRGGHTRA